MVGFLIKKSFFDGWDNFLQLFLANLSAGALLVITFFIVHFLSSIPVYLFVFVVFGIIILFNLCALVTSCITFQWSRYSIEWKDNLKIRIKTHVWHVLLSSAVWFFIFFTIAFIIPFYIQSKSFFGLFVTIILFWVMAALIPAMQYFFPLLQYKPDDKPLLTLKKCFAVEFNNKLLTLFITLRTFLDFCLTVCTCFIVPGFAGISIGHMDAVRLILIRYDYMRSHCIKKKHDVNTFDMLEEERNNVGPRTIRGMIFPWKN